MAEQQIDLGPLAEALREQTERTNKSMITGGGGPVDLIMGKSGADGRRDSSGLGKGEGAGSPPQTFGNGAAFPTIEAEPPPPPKTRPVREKTKKEIDALYISKQRDFVEQSYKLGMDQIDRARAYLDQAEEQLTATRDRQLIDIDHMLDLNQGVHDIVSALPYKKDSPGTSGL